MVNLSSILQARGPHLIYGVKRGKVPTKLSAAVVSKKTYNRRAPCMEEMFRVLSCWKQSSFIDSKCSDEIGKFMNCAQRHMENKESITKADKTWTPTEINQALKAFTELRGPRDH